MALLKCEDLVLGYDNTVLASDINIEIGTGEYHCIVGENGTGKTTLMKTILGLKEPLSGRIIYGDGLSKNEIGYLPQQTDAQRDFPASVKEIVLSGFQGRLGLRPFYSPEQKKEALANMERMGISDLRDRSYRELSGGQQQRVLLARALCATEKMLFLDEPVAGLDPQVTVDMYELINRLNREDKTAIIMITHDIDAARKYATHLIRFESNEVVTECLKN